MNKYIYLINGKETTRQEFKNQLALIYCKLFGSGICAIASPDYEKAENTIKNIQRKKCKLSIFSNNKHFKIEKVNN